MIDVHPGLDAPEDATGRGDPARPARRRAFVAAWVCPETERLGRELDLPLAVVAATADPARHAARLARTMYGAWSPRGHEEWPLPFDEGMVMPVDVAYRQLPFDPRWLGSRTLPAGVDLEGGCLGVDLPGRASVGDLAAILRAGLSELSYDRVARRPDQVRHRHFTRRPVLVAPRYALVRPGDVERVVPADDLFRFGPGDLGTLAAAVALSVGSLAIATAVDGLGTGEVRHG